MVSVKQTPDDFIDNSHFNFGINGNQYNDLGKFFIAGLASASGAGDLIMQERSLNQQQQQFSQGLAEQKRINNANINLANKAQQWQRDTDQRNYDYMVAENELQKAREDTAHQREVADLKAAGLSPLASLQGSTTGNTVSQAMGVSPVVPQMDGTGIANLYATSMANQASMAGIRSQFFRDIMRAGTELEKQKIQHNFEREKIDTEFKNTLTELEEKYKNEGNLEGLKFINRMNEITTRFNNDFTLLTETKNKESAENEAERMSRELGVPTRITSKSPEWCATNNGRVSSEFKLLLKELEPYLKETGSSEHSGSISSKGGGIGAKFPLPMGKGSNYGNDFDIFDDYGGNANFQTSKGSSSGSSKRENPVAYANERIRAFWADDNHIIYIPYRSGYGR